MPLPFTLRPYRRFPVPCSVASNAVPVYVLGRYRFWFRLGSLSIAPNTGLGVKITGLTVV